jgi:hypothetical protein
MACGGDVAYSRHPVPRFYLHLANGEEFTEDEEGAVFATFEAAHAKAVEGLRDVLAGDLRRGELNRACFIEIEDEDHNLLVTVFFDEAVTLRDEPGRGRGQHSVGIGAKLPE